MLPNSWRELDDATKAKMNTPKDYIKWLIDSALEEGYISSGGGSEVVLNTFTAGENISGGKVVMLSGGEAFNFDVSNTGNYAKAVGVSNQASSTGQSIEVVISGLCTQMGGLTPGGVYFASTLGNLSLTAPVSGISQIIGVAQDATKIVVLLQKPYIKI